MFHMEDHDGEHGIHHCLVDSTEDINQQLTDNHTAGVVKRPTDSKPAATTQHRAFTTVHLTPTSYLPNMTVAQHLGRISLHVIKAPLSTLFSMNAKHSPEHTPSP